MNEHEAGLLADDLDEEMYFQVQFYVLDWSLKRLQGQRQLQIRMRPAT
jgi:hypothetical protein